MVVPKTKRATKNTEIVPASSGRGIKAVNAAISAAVVGREPNRPSATPASGMVMVAAKAMTKRAMPSSAGSMPRRARTSGMWVAQMPMPRPETRKA